MPWTGLEDSREALIKLAHTETLARNLLEMERVGVPQKEALEAVLVAALNANRKLTDMCVEYAKRDTTPKLICFICSAKIKKE